MYRFLKKVNPLNRTYYYKKIPYGKSTKSTYLLIGTILSFGLALNQFKKKEKRGQNPLKQGYFRQKYDVPPYEAVLAQVKRRHYEQPLTFTTKYERPGGEEDMRIRMERLVRNVQNKVSIALSEIENDDFKEDVWQRADGSGGGVVRVIQDGKYLEKGGINFSVSEGELSEEAQTHMIGKNTELDHFLKKVRKSGKKVPFFAASISSVIHPKNPHAPTVHFNYRYFEVGEVNPKGEFVAKHWWFGGGCDLTPSVLYEEDCKHFHGVYRNICERFQKGSYAKFKKQCDDYFFIPYRKEHRGIGGVFFDGLQGDREKVFSFIDEMANAFVEAYLPILLRRCTCDFDANDKRWQELRRGRYAEFNVAVDRGTKFGRSRENANLEAIHISLPLRARFEYKAEPTNDNERRLLEVLKTPVDWLSLDSVSIE